MTDKIKARFIFEILGKPAEHIKETLSQMIDKLEEIKGVKISEKTIHEPKLIEDEKVKDMYTTFAEVEVVSETMNAILAIIFNMFPANVEIIEPETFVVKNFDYSGLLNEVIAKIHRYDEVTKRLLMERNMLVNKIKEMSTQKEEVKTEQPKKKKKSRRKIKILPNPPRTSRFSFYLQNHEFGFLIVFFGLFTRLFDFKPSHK
jgi:hypothetical protein